MKRAANTAFDAMTALDAIEQPAWYAIWTCSHFEQAVNDQLAVKGFEMFLPRATICTRSSRLV